MKLISFASDKSHLEMEMSRNEKLIDLNNLIGFSVVHAQKSDDGKC